jgi:hypothetical protein
MVQTYSALYQLCGPQQQYALRGGGGGSEKKQNERKEADREKRNRSREKLQGQIKKESRNRTKK